MSASKKPRSLSNLPEKDRDAAFIRDPDLWGMWPFCPVKKPSARGAASIADKTMGVLLCTQEHLDAVAGKPGSTFVIYHGYLYMWPNTPEGVKALPTTAYPTLDALQADGWVVD